MDLRCLVFSSDEASAPVICQVLADLGAEADYCPEAAAAIGRVASESFQIVIADWDEQPNAEYLLKAARARKPNERALTLAVVSDDASVPKALQAGANSVLRKPVLLNQVRDTLETARSLLKAKQEAPASGTTLPSTSNSAPVPPPSSAATETHLRAGDFLSSAHPAPSAQFDTEQAKQLAPADAVIDPLKDLEPMAAAVTPEKPSSAEPPTPSPSPNESRGLQWYLNQRGPNLPSTPTTPMPAPPLAAQPELMGYDQMAAAPQPAPVKAVETAPAPLPDPVREKQAEAELFSYITHGSGESSDPEESSRPGFRLGKGAIAFAALLAFCAIVSAPQAPWHPAALRLWARGGRSLHAWLNPQVVAPPQAPETHESFGRAGDEYKLPVPENIPDATTDPSQIRVVPVVDPTAKKPGNGNADQNGENGDSPVDVSSPAPDQSAGAQVPQDSSQPAPANSNSAGTPQASAASGSPSPIPQTGSAAAPTQTVAPGSAPPASNSAAAPPQASSSPSHSGPSSNAPAQIAASAPPIPSSLKSQMASTVPDASGNKAPETALPSIEPVAVAEPAERELLVEQPPIAYPDSAKGQQGTVILQLLIGRDGSVQDAKFLQGSLAFARAAIDGVRSWKFKPYVMNGRPVSVQTQLTLNFNPTK